LTYNSSSLDHRLFRSCTIAASRYTAVDAAHFRTDIIYPDATSPQPGQFTAPAIDFTHRLPRPRLAATISISIIPLSAAPFATLKLPHHILVESPKQLSL
jgi:hypothetical protein